VRNDQRVVRLSNRLIEVGLEECEFDLDYKGIHLKYGFDFLGVNLNAPNGNDEPKEISS
ncbi:hypothetical protein KI387_017187, partial [Taxus chinensis]